MAEPPSRLPGPGRPVRDAAPGSPAVESDPAGHPVGTGDAAWCRPLLFSPDVDSAERLSACAPLAHRPGRRAVIADRTSSLRTAAPGLAVVAVVISLVALVAVGLPVALPLGLLAVATPLVVSFAATVRAARRADRSTAADAARQTLRQRLSGQVVDPVSLAPPWRQLAQDTVRLQLAVAGSEDPRVVSAVDEAAGRVLAVIAADVDLRTAGDAARRVVVAAPDADADAGALRSRLAEADATSTALVADASAALAQARLAVADARSGDAALESARLRALGDLDRAVIAARALDRGSGERRSQDGSQDT